MTTANASERIYSVYELNHLVRQALERNFSGIRIEAEVSGVKHSAAGHIYFDLVDPAGAAQISAVMWKGAALRYGAKIVSGTRIRIDGQLTVYEKNGKYQFVATRVEEAGAGARALALKKLAARLEGEGLFDSARKRKLPPSPSCVGVVTSRQGAALQDIIKVMSRRFPVRLVLAHASVQGETAPEEIVEGIVALSAVPGIEVIIVGRGGGSAEDLDAFNDERVVRAVSACPVPVISAVGHEVDISLCDRAADRRAATPSEAAELAVPELSGLADELGDLRNRLGRSMAAVVSRCRHESDVVGGHLQQMDPRTRLAHGRTSLERCRAGLAQWSARVLPPKRNRLALLDARLRAWPQRAVDRAGGQLASASEGVFRWNVPFMDARRAELGQLVVALDALSPLASIARGYAVVRKVDHRVVKSAADVELGERVRITLARGEFDADVTAIRPAKGENEENPN